MFPKARPESVLFITLDSCRYDVFLAARIPSLRAVGPIHRAMAPSYYTYASHASMFMGFTPGDAGAMESFLNPIYGKIFKMRGGGFSGKGKQKFILKGKNAVDGFKKRGYFCLGSGALNWFDPDRETGRVLTQDFHEFFFPGSIWFLDRQLDWLARKLKGMGRPVCLIPFIIPYVTRVLSGDSRFLPNVTSGSTALRKGLRFAGGPGVRSPAREGLVHV